MGTDFPEGAALVFGGSGGIGQGVALEFARAGSAVAIAYRSKRDVAERVADAIGALGVKASIHPLDVRDAARAMALRALGESAARHDGVMARLLGHIHRRELCGHINALLALAVMIPLTANQFDLSTASASWSSRSRGI